MPLAISAPDRTASAHASRPVASRTQVSGSVSMTFGGVPRVWRGPDTHWTAPYGGTRTSTERPGALAASSASRARVASRRTSRSGSAPRSSARRATSTAAKLGCAEDTTGRYDAGAGHSALTLPRSEEHTSELQSQSNLVCRLLLEKKKKHRTPDLS